MWTRISKLRVPSWMPGARQSAFVALTLILSGAAFLMGKRVGLSPASGQQLPFQASPNQPNNLPAFNDEYSKRVVAYIYDKIPVTRGELAEHLIARYGPERINFLINRKILELECQKYGVNITDAEVEAQYRQDLQGMKLSQTQFQEQVLKRFNKTLYEWKEDVIRQKLAVNRLVRSQIQINADDLRIGFEAKFGPKVKCRMVVYDNEGKAVTKRQAIVESPDPTKLFLEEAEKQFIHPLAARRGDVPAIHKHFPNIQVEQEVFRLKPGQVSAIVQIDNTYAIFLCEKHEPQDLTKVFETERFQIEREMLDKRISERLPTYFAQLRSKASPNILMEHRNVFQEDVTQKIESNIKTPVPGVSAN